LERGVPGSVEDGENIERVRQDRLAQGQYVCECLLARKLALGPGEKGNLRTLCKRSLMRENALE
jgi:hypothetical protein